jgi:hypothetical protein
MLRVKVPTGDENKGLGTGATDIEIGIDLIQRHGALNWLLDLGYTWVGNAFGSKPRNVLRLGGGVSLPFGMDERSSGYVYLENRTNRYQGTEDQRSLAVGVSTSFDDAKRVRMSASLFFGLSDSTEDVGVYITAGRRY